MEYTHRFSSGPMSMSTVLDEYYKPAKVNKIGKQVRNIGKYWSNPPFRFNPEDVLKKFKYLYLIGREYEIPRLDRQKTVGVRDVGNYSKKVNEKMENESWEDMMNFERDHPGTLALMPGHCLICEKQHLNCTRKSNKPCCQPGAMRFSIEGLGLDADAMSKFELGLLTKWPEDGHLPMRMNVLMGFLSDEIIPIEEFQSYFPDAKKSYVNFINSSSDKIENQAKRQESWLDNQSRQRKELEELASAPDRWSSGYKSSDMVSSSVMQEKPWLEVDEPNPTESTAGLPSEHLGIHNNPSLPNEHLGFQDVHIKHKTDHSDEPQVGLPNEHFHTSKITNFFDDDEYPPPKRDQSYSDNFQKPEAEVFEEQAEEEDDSKYKWLGFKRSIEEVEREFYNRPIRKFNVPEDEEAEVVDVAQTEENIIKAQTPEEPVEYQEQPEPQTAEPETTDFEAILSQLSLDDLKEILAKKIVQEVKSEKPEEQETKLAENIELPNAASIDNVIDAALTIAKEVSKNSD